MDILMRAGGVADRMADFDDEMPDPQLGSATIVYDDPGGERVVTEVDNEHLIYFQDHWQVKTGEDDDGNDVVRRIPRERVWHVERSVEEFQDRLDSALDEAKDRLDF